MLIEFSVSNFLSFKNPVTFSMVASNSVKELEGENDELNNVFTDGKLKYLKSATIYGANGSGKSNLISALGFFQDFILSSSKESTADEQIDTIPFLLNSATENQPSSFELVFKIGNTRYRYGFETTQEEITAEWLHFVNTDVSQKESTCFTREYQQIKVNTKTFKEGKGVEIRTRKNALFLSSVAGWNGAKSIELQNWINENINLIGDGEETLGYTIEKFLEDPKFKKYAINFIKLMDIGIDDIQIERTILGKIFPEKHPKLNALMFELQEELKKVFEEDGEGFNITSYHKKYDEAMNLMDSVGLKFEFESDGTQKLFALLGPWFETLEKGSVLIIDEFGSNLHTKLSIELVKLFQSSINTNNAQLIFTSHDTNLLRNDLFRRDQIWFTEKDGNTGVSDLYSLVEYKINQATSVRNDASFEKDYLIGKYGAIPYFGDIKRFIQEFSSTDE